MWTSHFAPALAFKAHTPDVPITALALILAGTLPDLLWLILEVLGTEKIKHYEYPGCFPYDALYPYTHSSTGEMVLATLYTGLLWVVLGLQWRSARFVWIAVVSHWFLDLPVHRKGKSPPSIVCKGCNN